MKTLKEFKKHYKKCEYVKHRYDCTSVKFYFTQGIEHRFIVDNTDEFIKLKSIICMFEDINMTKLDVGKTHIGLYNKFYYKNGRHAITLYLYEMFK